MPIAAILAGARSVVSGVADFAKTWLGGAIIAFCIAWLWSGWRHDAACTRRVSAIEASIKAKTAEELERRAHVLLETKAEALEDARKLESENEDLKAKLKELEHASHANDGRPGLPADGVRRLNKF